MFELRTFPRKELGMVVMTNGIESRIKESIEFAKFIEKSFTKYLFCNWGDLEQSDKELNDRALTNGDDRILARYEYDGEPIYIITEYDRRATTILFASEY